MILAGTGGTAGEAGGGGGSASLRRPEVYAARKLRRAMTLPEVLLWQRLRGRQAGLRVRRQHPIGPYVVDFYVPERGLVVEVDGEAHGRGDAPERDQRRDRALEERGLRVFRVMASDVLKDADEVVCWIVAEASRPLHHAMHGPPPRPGEDRA